MYDSIYIKSYINRIYNDRKKISDCLEKEELQRSMRKFVCGGGMVVFIIVIVVMISGIFTYDRTY